MTVRPLPVGVELGDEDGDELGDSEPPLGDDDGLEDVDWLADELGLLFAVSVLEVQDIEKASSAAARVVSNLRLFISRCAV